MIRSICASVYVIDFKNQELLMVYNKKLDKHLQPGGHIENEEMPMEAAIRETLEETGITPIIIGNKFMNITQPLAVEVYNTKIGQMIDIQYVGITDNKKITDNENNNAKWLSYKDVISSNNIDDEIKEKFKYILREYSKYINKGE